MTRTTGEPESESRPRPWRHRWGWSVVLLSLVILGVGAWRVLFVPRFTVTATLHVASAPRSILFEPKDKGVDAATYRKTVVSLLTDPYTLSHAMGSPKVAGLETVKKLASQNVDVEDWLHRNLNVSFHEGSEVLEVSLSGENANDLATLVNEVVNSFMTLWTEEARHARLSRLEKLKELLVRYQRELKVKRAALKDLAAATSLDHAAASESEREESAQQRALVRQELLRAELALAAAKARLARRGKDGASQSERDKSEDEIAGYEAQTEFLTKELERLQARKSQGGPLDLVSERSEIAMATEMARLIGVEVEHMEVELDAPARVRVLSPAKPSGARAWRKFLLAGW